MKLIKRLLIGLIALIAVAIGVTWMCLNGIVRSAVQSQASSQLGVQTTLGGAEVSVFGPNLALSNLKIASPKGYPAPHLFTFGGTKVAVSVTQLTGTPIRVESIAVNN